MPAFSDALHDCWPYPALIAHRGAGRLAPENTLAAIRLGWRLGYRMFEFDAKLSADGAVVLMHDELLERTTNGRGPVAQHRLLELQQLDAGGWHSPAMSGEPVPTLDAVADWLLERGGFANIEIKPCAGREVETGVAVALRALERWAGRVPPPLLSSFSEAALAAARLSAPDLPLGLLFDRPPRDWLARARALDCASVHLHWKFCVASFVEHAHAAGLRVCCYTVNDPVRARLLRRIGVDSLITDALELIRPGA